MFFKLDFFQFKFYWKNLVQFNIPFHIWCYSPFQALASLIWCLHSSLFSALLLHPLISSSCNAPLWTTSTHLVLGNVQTFHVPKINSFSLHPGRLLFVKPIQGIWGFLNANSFPRCGHHPHTQPPTWRTRVSIFVWVITFDLSSLGDPASSYATASLALRIIWPHKPHHYVKVGTRSRGQFNITGLLSMMLCLSVGRYHHFRQIPCVKNKVHLYTKLYGIIFQKTIT